MHISQVTRPPFSSWAQLHEAVRNGDHRLVRFLLDRGADVNARTGKHGEGGSAVWLAQHYHEDGHPVFDILREREGKKFQPEL